MMDLSTQLIGRRILFLTGASGRDRLMFGINEELQRRGGFKDYYVSEFPRNRVFLEKQGVCSDKIIDFPRFCPCEGEADVDYLRGCEERYGLRVWSVWETIRRKKNYAGISRERVLRFFDYAFRLSEDICVGVRPDYLVANAVSAYQFIVLCRVADACGVRVVELNESRISNRFTIKNNFQHRLPLLDHNYSDVLGRGLSVEEVGDAKGFINGFLNGPQRDGFLLNRFTFLSRYFRLNKIGRVVSGAVADKSLPINFLRFNLRVKLMELFYRSIGVFKQPRVGDKFVLYPLHYDPEIATLLYGEWYANQLNLIQILSKSLPVDYFLYVKEHPFSYGNRSLSFYREVSSLPNVRLISPYADMFDLIRGCSLVATITGTVGFEALFFRKPVITFGDVFYNVFEEVGKVRCVADLPRIIREKIDGGLITEGGLLQFMLAFHNSLHEGLAVYPEMCGDLSVEAGNVVKLVDGIEEYLGVVRC